MSKFDVLLMVLVLLAFGTTAYKHWPGRQDALDIPSCSCTDDKGPDCEEKLFKNGHHEAKCAFWSERSSCCVIIDLEKKGPGEPEPFQFSAIRDEGWKSSLGAMPGGPNHITTLASCKESV